jgi:hypothetical protein
MEREISNSKLHFFPHFKHFYLGQNSSFPTSKRASSLQNLSRTRAQTRKDDDAREEGFSLFARVFFSFPPFAFLSLSFSLSLDVATVSRWTSTTTSRLREQTKRRNEKSKSGERDEDDSERCFCCALWWQNQRLLVSWIGGDDATRGANFFFEFVFEFERFWNT